MLIRPTPLAGAALVELTPHRDERGFLARTFCGTQFAAAGLEPVVAQCNLAVNRRAGTLRGFHYQLPPHAEAKTVHCVRGAVHDVIVDVRPDSPTYLRHFGVELSATNRLALHVPAGFAHAYLTLADDTAVFYLASTAYAPGAERGLRWDDPALAVEWPVPVRVVSDKDASWPLLTGAAR